jgi:hypothetical protein
MRVLGLEWWTFRPYRPEAPSFGCFGISASEGLSAQRPNRMGGGIGLGIRLLGVDRIAGAVPGRAALSPSSAICAIRMGYGRAPSPAPFPAEPRQDPASRQRRCGLWVRRGHAAPAGVLLSRAAAQALPRPLAVSTRGGVVTGPVTPRLGCRPKGLLHRHGRHGLFPDYPSGL